MTLNPVPKALIAEAKASGEPWSSGVVLLVKDTRAAKYDAAIDQLLKLLTECGNDNLF